MGVFRDIQIFGGMIYKKNNISVKLPWFWVWNTFFFLFLKLPWMGVLPIYQSIPVVVSMECRLHILARDFFLARASYFFLRAREFYFLRARWGEILKKKKKTFLLTGIISADFIPEPVDIFWDKLYSNSL